MWKDYCKSYIKNNHISSVTVMAAAIMATFFLSLLCTLAYNAWTYDIERIELTEGDWQGRITGRIDNNQLSSIMSFSNVDKTVVNTELSDDDNNVIDIYFSNPRTIYDDLPLIQQYFSLEDEAVEYHELLLSRYLIHNPEDDSPPLLMLFFILVLMVVAASLILIIRNSFELSMNSRISQLGIFSSIGATPKQIRLCLVEEAAYLCAVPLLLGYILGILAGMGVLQAVNTFARDVSGRHAVEFQYSPLVLMIAVITSVLTIFLSAWLPARKLSKMSPLQAIRGTGIFKLKKRKHSRILALLFGIEGELAGNALKAQKKSLRIGTVSLLLSFLGFSVMLSFTTLSDISTRYTYFERYQDDWDIMMTVKDTDAAEFDKLESIKSTTGIDDIVLYQKAKANVYIQEKQQSKELQALGGLKSIAGLPLNKGKYKAEAAVIVMDDDSFLRYCSRVGAAPALDGAIILNQIWNSKNSNFRNKEYVPYINESLMTETLDSINTSGLPADIRILSYTEEAPVLREEYDNNKLVHFIPLSLWNSISDRLAGMDPDSNIRILTDKNAVQADLDTLNTLEDKVIRLIGKDFDINSENRIQEKLTNDEMKIGLQLIFGAFCVLLALIGLANIMFNTLGFLRQRKQEFARYMSIGLTPREMIKMFGIEAFVIAGRPIIITIPITIVSIQLMTSASHLDSWVFWSEAPVIPVLVFALCIVLFVSLAYYIGGRKILHCNLNEALRDDTI